MNLHHVSFLSPALAGAGGALAGASLGGRIGGTGLAAGAVLLVAALLVAALVAARARGAVRRLRRWADDDATEVAAPPAVPEPFADVARALRRRLDGLADQLRARQSEARRARVAARSLEQEHGVLRSLLDGLSDGVVLLDAAGVPGFVNGAARRLLALPAAAAGRLEPRELQVAPALKAALAEGIRGETVQARRTRDVDGSDQSQRLVLRLTFQAVPAPSGQTADASLAILLADVTREVELNRMKSNFASSVSHELKTPLCSMRAFLEMLLDGDIEGEQEQREHIQRILDETERLTRLVQNLLNLSRLEAGITRMEQEPVDVAALLDHLREVVAPLAAARHQTIVFEISDFLPPVTGDKSLLEQAFMNLISNAIKYTPEGGAVEVRAGIAGGHAELVVKDTGVGIPEKALGLIFEKFTRVENSAGLQATGTGLGLPLARFVAESHGGGITVRSEVGKGSEFTLRIPARRGDTAREAKLIGLEGISA